MTTTPAPPHTASGPGIPGRLGQRLARLASAATVGDLYAGDGARVYHEVTLGDGAEIPELLRVARRSRGPVLELAAGSGRITLPLLSLGRPVTAVELSPDMIALLRERVATLPRRSAELLTCVLGDMREIDVEDTFDTVVIGATSICLLDAPGRARVHRAVNQHLADTGRYLLTLNSPVPTPADGTERVDEQASALGPGVTLYNVALAGADRRWVAVVIEGADGRSVRTSTVWELTAAALDDELADAGFTVEDRIALPAAPGRRHEVISARIARRLP